MQFKIVQTYSRKTISHYLGGSIQSYLPFKADEVLCGCFKKIPRYNPDAPDVVTIGPGPDVERSARLVYSQGQRGQSIPVFLFRGNTEWEYIGRYRCTEYSRDSDKIRKEMKDNPERGLIVGILYFQRTSD